VKSTDQLQKVVAAIEASHSFGVLSHIDPDGDAAGCMIATLVMLRALGKEAHCLQSQEVPDIYNFLPGYDLLIEEHPIRRYEHQELDCVLVLDCSNPTRISWDYDQASYPAKTVVNIDHHKDNSLFGDLLIVDPKATSTAELVFRLVQRFGLSKDLVIGTAIYTGMATDTGYFTYSNTTAKAMRIGAELLETGVDVAFLRRNLDSCFTPNRLAFLGKVLSSIETTDDGAVVWMRGTLDMRRETDFWGSTEQFANYAMKTRSAQVGLLFVQEDDSEYKVSIRSRGKIDAGEFAARYGGGGHARAAGCRFTGNLEEVLSDMICIIQRGLGEGVPSTDRSRVAR